jgi:hypothetical protein
MAHLPSHYPSLALHLSDRALTPIISSSAGSGPGAPDDRDHDRLPALTALTSTALAAHDAAQRLDLGSPLRLVVEFADAGPVVLSAFLDPPTAAYGGNNAAAVSAVPATAGDEAGGPSAAIAADADAVVNGTEPFAGTGARMPHNSPYTSTQRPSRAELLSELAPAAGHGGGGPSPAAADGPPMLLGVVVAPDADHWGEARRAAARLERVGRAMQAALAAEEPRRAVGRPPGESMR